MTHELKILPKWYADVESGKKNFEIRVNDRDYKVGDTLVLQEYDKGGYTGRHITRKIQYIYQGNGAYGLSDEYCILGLDQEPSGDATLKDIFCMGCEYKEQEPKTAHWEVVSDGYGDNAYICECSECKDTVWVYKDADRKWNYCPNCGARMESEVENDRKRISN